MRQVRRLIGFHGIERFIFGFFVVHPNHETALASVSALHTKRIGDDTRNSARNIWRLDRPERLLFSWKNLDLVDLALKIFERDTQLWLNFENAFKEVAYSERNRILQQDWARRSKKLSKDRIFIGGLFPGSVSTADYVEQYYSKAPDVVWCVLVGKIKTKYSTPRF